MSFSKKVFRSGLSNILLNVVNMLIGLGLAPFVVHTLGDVQNGYWVIARMVFGYYGFVDFGVGLSIARFLSLSVGKKDHTEAKKIVQTGLAFILSIDALFLILCVAALFWYWKSKFFWRQKISTRSCIDCRFFNSCHSTRKSLRRSINSTYSTRHHCLDRHIKLRNPRNSHCLISLFWLRSQITRHHFWFYCLIKLSFVLPHSSSFYEKLPVVHSRI